MVSFIAGTRLLLGSLITVVRLMGLYTRAAGSFQQQNMRPYLSVPIAYHGVFFFTKPGFHAKNLHVSPQE